MVLKEIFGKKGEIELEAETKEPEKIMVRVEKLTGIMDVDNIIKLLTDGYILFINVKELQKKDLGQFQGTLQRLKRSCMKYGWDIVAIEGGYLVMTPSFAKIIR